jgi:hypothetical protein
MGLGVVLRFLAFSAQAQAFAAQGPRCMPSTRFIRSSPRKRTSPSGNAQPSHGRGLFVCAGRMCGLARLRESAVRRRIRKFGPAGGELPVGSHCSASRPPLRKKAIRTLVETIGGRLGLPPPPFFACYERTLLRMAFLAPANLEIAVRT